jgi:hypothetical protein
MGEMFERIRRSLNHFNITGRHCTPKMPALTDWLDMRPILCVEFSPMAGAQTPQQ